MLSVRRWSGAFPDRRYQRRLLTAPGSEAVFLIHIQRRGHLFEVVHGRPAFIAPAFPRLSSAQCPQAAHIRGGSGGSVCPQLVLDRGRGAGYSRGLFCGSGGVLLQNGKDSGAVKIVAQLAGGNGLCPVRREVTKPPRLSLTVTPSRSREEKSSNEAAADSAARMVCRASLCSFQTWSAGA